ncbi:ion transporter [Confluentibacter sediminis]|uniref:ion transporter n=1 Tax=Confluentibacter sediminis TaxID=2219045 RepID=UPI000DACA046|nr:ion transporter [Confluentibacter sediminis]
MDTVKSKFDIFRQKVHIIIYGTNTMLGKLFDLVLLGLILLSVLMVMLETVDFINEKYHRILLVCEWIITIFFTIEYLLRIISIKKPSEYLFSFYGIIDFIAILPMYLSFFLGGAQVLSVVRALRLLRLFRILNLVSFTGQASQLKLALKTSRVKIVVFIYFVLVICILLGSLMYVIEGKANGFTSIPVSIYWCIVTLTTVGYGDIHPITPLGQVIASFIMILGYGIIAVPTGIVTAELAQNKRKGSLFLLGNRNPCPNCGEQDHMQKAEFCYNCGHKLNDD